MAEVKDILFDDDISISLTGDLDVGESDKQHIEHILQASPGQFYQFPSLGVGVIKDINSNINEPTLKQRINENLEADNFRVNRIEITGQGDSFKVAVDATRKS